MPNRNPPEPRCVGAVISNHETTEHAWTTVTTMVECPRCYALVAGDRQEHHEDWHASARVRSIMGGIG